jgi:hypothetical protein
MVCGCVVLMAIVSLNDSYGDESSTVKQINWGLETWELGKQSFVIEFKEQQPVRILGIVGNITAGPLPSEEDASEDGKLIRQSLITLINPGKNWTVSDVEIKQTPGARANHSLAPHLFNINIKQQADAVLIVPVNYDFRNQKIILPDNQLLMHFDNRSYRFDKNSKTKSFESKDPFDALNTEIHLNVIYDIQSP